MLINERKEKREREKENESENEGKRERERMNGESNVLLTLIIIRESTLPQFCIIDCCYTYTYTYLRTYVYTIYILYMYKMSNDNICTSNNIYV